LPLSVLEAGRVGSDGFERLDRLDGGDRNVGDDFIVVRAEYDGSAGDGGGQAAVNLRSVERLLGLGGDLCGGQGGGQTVLPSLHRLRRLSKVNIKRIFF